MKKTDKILWRVALVGMAIFGTNALHAQSAPVELTEAEFQPRLMQQQTIAPRITVDRFLPLGEKVLFDATDSALLPPSEGDAVYNWDFDDGSRVKYGAQVTHEFGMPGRYDVKLQVRQGRVRESINMTVTVYQKKAVMIADQDVDTDGLVARAGRHGIWLDVIPFGRTVSAEEQFGRKLQEKNTFLGDAESVIFYTDSAAAMQQFAQWWQKVDPEQQIDPREKMWVQVGAGSLAQLEKLMRSSYRILEPHAMFLVRAESLDVVFSSSSRQLSESLRSRGLEVRIVDDRATESWLLPLSRAMTFFVSRGVSQSVIFLLLAVPFVTFVIAGFRQFIGLRTFGVFAPLMLALSFLLLGLQFGFIVFAVVMVVSYLIRLLFDRVELLYIPKISLLLSALSLSFFLVLGLAVVFGSDVSLALAVFPMLVMSTVSEKFLSAQSEGGLRSALHVAIETVMVALAAYALVRWGWLENLILSLPEVILLPIFGNIWLGRFTGLRLTEYFRFAALFNDDLKE